MILQGGRDPLDTNNDTTDNLKQTEFTTVTGKPIKVDGVRREEWVSIRSLFKAKDSLGQFLPERRHDKDAANSIALFCLRAASLTYEH